MEILKTFVHYFLHLGAPFFIAKYLFKDNWRQAYLILLLTMAVDVDHLLATPIFDPERCSIGFHPLHSYLAIAGYFLLLFIPGKVRIVATGLLFHMFTDFQDCYFW